MGYIDSINVGGTEYDIHDKRSNGLDMTVSGSGIVYGRFAAGAPLSVTGTSGATVVHTSGNLLTPNASDFNVSDSFERFLLGYSIPAGTYRLTIGTFSGVSSCRVYFRKGTSGSTNVCGSVTPETGKDIVVTFNDICQHVYVSQGSGKTDSSVFSVTGMALVGVNETWDGSNGTPEELTMTGAAVKTVSFGGDHFIPSAGNVAVSGATNASGRLEIIERQLAELQAIVLESDN